jgi:hypothetical protein
MKPIGSPQARQSGWKTRACRRPGANPEYAGLPRAADQARVASDLAAANRRIWLVIGTTDAETRATVGGFEEALALAGLSKIETKSFGTVTVRLWAP